MDKLKIKYIFSSQPNVVLLCEKININANRNKQIELFLEELSLYDVLLKDLINYPPKQKQRNIILNISYYLLENKYLTDNIQRKRDLCIRNICKKLEVEEGFLRRWRDYIIFYYIIFSNDDYNLIQQYLKIEERLSNIINLNNKNKAEFLKGIVIKILRNSAYILTPSGEIINIKCDKNTRIGQEFSGKEKKSFRHFKMHFCIVAVIIMIIGISFYSKYFTSTTTVMVNTTSSLKLECNFLDKVIYSYSDTEKGKKLIISTDIFNANIDHAIKEVLEYSINNEMIPSDNKILITVNGETLKYGSLKETGKFVYEINEKNKSQNKGQVLVSVNNGGNEHKLTSNLYE